jgi:hypothetical protein
VVRVFLPAKKLDVRLSQAHDRCWSLLELPIANKAADRNVRGTQEKEKATNISVSGLYLCRQRPTLPHTWRVQYNRPCGA